MTPRYRFMVGVAIYVALTTAAFAAGMAEEPYVRTDFEIWALDQATNVIHIVSPVYEGLSLDFETRHRIEFDEGVVRPHMIDFTSDYRYAFVANTVSGNVAVIRTADREVIAILDTGPGSHMASVTPDDSRVIVDVIGTGTVIEILLDLESEQFSFGRSIVLSDAPAIRDRAEAFARDDDGRPIAKPICHDYTADGRYAYITLGPGLATGGLVVLDTDIFEVVKAWGGDEVSVNCGTILSHDGSRMYVNGGSLDEGSWYVFDTATHDPVYREPRSSFGKDAHGVGITPDGKELWMVNRSTSDGIVVDTATQAVIEYLPFVGESPDILAFSPDGRLAFVTLRGPAPLSGPHANQGFSPGFSVIDVQRRKVIKIIQPEPDVLRSDFHGLGVIPLE